jgi:DNA-binding beta-propeller fold protein YncE
VRTRPATKGLSLVRRGRVRDGRVQGLTLPLRDLWTRGRRRENVDRRRFLAAAAAGSLALAVDPRGLAARASGFAATALVTADLESHVVVLDLDSARVISRFPTASDPRSIESVGGTTAVVAHTEIGVVSVLALVGGIGLRAELDRFEAPRYTAVHPRRPLAYVTDSAREEVVVLDAEEGLVVGRTRVPGPTRHISISRDGRTIWTALGTTAARVAVLDASNPLRPRLVRTFSPPFLAHDIAFAQDGRAAWVTSGDERRVALYHSGDTRRPARVLDAGSPPQHVSFARDKAFVASGDDGTVHRHRLDGSLVREARVPTGSYNVCFDLGRVVTPSLRQGTVAVLDRNGRVLATRKVARAAHDACIVHTR